MRTRNDSSNNNSNNNSAQKRPQIEMTIVINAVAFILLRDVKVSDREAMFQQVPHSDEDAERQQQQQQQQQQRTKATTDRDDDVEMQTRQLLSSRVTEEDDDDTEQSARPFNTMPSSASPRVRSSNSSAASPRGLLPSASSPRAATVVAVRSQSPAASAAPTLRHCSVWTRVDFHLVFWSYMIAGTVPLIYMDNISFMLQSLGQSDAIWLHSVLLPVSSAIGRLFSGIGSDLLLHRWHVSRSYFIVCATLVVALVQLLLVLAMESVLVLASVLTGLSFGVLWCIGPALVSEEFGLTHFGQNWAYIILSSAFGMLILQAISGAVYESHVAIGGTVCEGVQCFQLTFIATSVLVLTSVVCALVLLRRVLSNNARSMQLQTV
eukprot:TRINITY_DN1350_c0_g1_i2.p2 TRINITY_DN1350_c0_g1~~TRINITY_DN1350_c0_g1_i2.p2  ORF type:complete len:379 (-),score=109.75 TRINITY_DN1350_c0_g1_i2:2095-3231(-)